MKKKRNLLIIDPITSDSPGHLLDDDLFWAINIPSKLEHFSIQSSFSSIQRIKDYYNVHNLNEIEATRINKKKLQRFPPRISQALSLLFLKTNNYSNILFQGFEETSIIIFKIFRPHKKIHLIVTNNLSQDRFSNHLTYTKLILWLTFRISTKIFIHSNFEREFLIRDIHVNPSKIVQKPYQKLSFHWKILPYSKRAGYILFFGSIRPSRSHEPILDIIKGDFSKKYDYLIAGITKQNYELFHEIRHYSNVTIISNSLSNEKYISIISNASLIILTHNKFSEGRLSGIFCDAVATETPIVSAAIAPVTEYFLKYGKLGLLVDYSNPQWFKPILNDTEIVNRSIFHKSIEKIRRDNSVEAIVDCIINSIYQS